MTRARQLSPGRSPLSSLRDGQWLDGDRPSLERPGPDAPRPTGPKWAPFWGEYRGPGSGPHSPASVMAVSSWTGRPTVAGQSQELVRITRKTQ